MPLSERFSPRLRARLVRQRPILVVGGALLALGAAWGAVDAVLALGFWGVLAALALSPSRRRFSPGRARGTAAPRAAPPLSRQMGDLLPDPLLLLDASGRVRLASAAAEALFGRTGEGEHVSGLIRDPGLLEAVAALAEGGAPRRLSYRMPVPIERHFSVSVAAAEGFIVVALHEETENFRLEQMRTDFVAHASHELKTPLAVFTTALDTLRAAPDDAEARARIIGLLETQTARMVALVDDLLWLSRIERHEHRAPETQLALVPVIREAMEALAPVAEGAGVAIEFAPPDDVPPLPGAHEELVHLFQNLMDNAIKYAASGKRVEVRLEAREEAGRRVLRVQVRDFGEGIARHHLPRLTERFYRVDPQASRVRGGTGLGLAIVKHILNRHRGTLTIESREGEGSVFSVTLPCA